MAFYPPQRPMGIEPGSMTKSSRLHRDGIRPEAGEGQIKSEQCFIK